MDGTWIDAISLTWKADCRTEPTNTLHLLRKFINDELSEEEIVETVENATEQGSESTQTTVTGDDIETQVSPVQKNDGVKAETDEEQSSKAAL